jgi:hypothetical protein
MPYIWRIPDDHPPEMIAAYDRKRSADRFVFLGGEPLPPGLGAVRLSIEATSDAVSAWDCLPNNAGVPLVNPELAAVLLEHAERDVELVESLLETSTGERSDYRILSARSAVTAVDRSMSEYTLIPGTEEAILSFAKLVLIPGCLGAHALARAREYAPYLLVGDALAEHLGGFTGIQLTRPEDVRG